MAKCVSIIYRGAALLCQALFWDQGTGDGGRLRGSARQSVSGAEIGAPVLPARGADRRRLEPRGQSPLLTQERKKRCARVAATAYFVILGGLTSLLDCRIMFGYRVGRRQAVKPPGFGPGMRRFESCRPSSITKGAIGLWIIEPSRPNFAASVRRGQ